MGFQRQALQEDRVLGQAGMRGEANVKCVQWEVPAMPGHVTAEGHSGGLDAGTRDPRTPFKVLRFHL